MNTIGASAFGVSTFEITDYLDERNFLQTTYAISQKILENIRNGTELFGKISIEIVENEKKDVIIHGEERKINSSGTTTIENYRNTVTDILNSYQNYAQILIPLTWKYSDSDTIYDNLISQVVENYMHGKVPLKEI